MKKYLLFLLVITSLNSYSQIIFENGYYINDANDKINCQILNVDWKDNPTEFDYKLSENAENKRINISSVKEFSINNVFKFIKSSVNIDRSSEKINELSNQKNAVFNEETLFLKVLIEGDASLYSYQDGDLIRYFYSVGNSKIEQLVYKNYLHSLRQMGKNERYKQQLLTDLKCDNISLNDIENLKYKKNKLVKFFVKYNTCSNEEFRNFEAKEKIDLFKFNLRPGFNYSSLSIEESNDKLNIDFDGDFGFRIGVEAEFTLPFNKNKWAIILEPSYQYYKSEQEIIFFKSAFVERKTNVIVDYSSIDIPIGLRYYSFINTNSKLFFNASMAYNFPISKSLYAENRDVIDLEIVSRFNFLFGVGYKFKDKYSIEFRLQSRKILENYPNWDSKYTTASIIFGYKLF